MKKVGSSSILHALRRSGHRITGSRRALAEVVAQRSRYFTAAQVGEELRETGHRVGRATVFRTLDTLAELGVLSRIHESPGCHAYMLCPEEHHHHLVCSGCDLVIEVPHCPVDEEAKALAEATGFAIQGHRLEYYGLCGECRQKREAR